MKKEKKDVMPLLLEFILLIVMAVVGGHGKERQDVILLFIEFILSNV